MDEVDKGGYVTAYGQGLSVGLSGKECTFHVAGSSSKYRDEYSVILTRCRFDVLSLSLGAEETGSTWKVEVSGVENIGQWAD